MNVCNGRTMRHGLGVALAAVISLLSTSADSQPSESERRRKYMEKERQRTTAIQDRARDEALERRKRARQATDRSVGGDQNRVQSWQPTQSWQSKACDNFFMSIRSGSGHSYKVLRTALDAQGALPPTMAKKWPGFKLEWRLIWYADTCGFDAQQRHLTQAILSGGPGWDEQSYRPPSSSPGPAASSGSQGPNVSPEVRANWRQYLSAGNHRKLPTEEEKREVREERAARNAEIDERLQQQQYQEMAGFRAQLDEQREAKAKVKVTQSQESYDAIRKNFPPLFRLLHRNRPPARLGPLSADMVPRGSRTYSASEPAVRSHPLALEKSAGLLLLRSDKGATTTEFSLSKRGRQMMRRVVKIDESTSRVLSVEDTVFRVDKHRSIPYRVEYAYAGQEGELVGPK